MVQLLGAGQTLIEVLIFIKLKEVIHTMNLINEFGYSYWGAMNRIKRFEKQKLVEKLGSIRTGAYCLTNEGTRRLNYYEQVLHNFSHKP